MNLGRSGMEKEMKEKRARDESAFSCVFVQMSLVFIDELCELCRRADGSALSD